jgi:uncharacterized protein (DUF2141 family)
MTMFKTIFASALIASASVAAAEVPSSLEVGFTGIEQNKGAIMVVLFDSEDAFNGKGKPARVAKVRADDPAAAKARFEGLASGRYAIKSFHDVNDNGKMDSNVFGMPTEPFAFSNNARGVMGPAKWADAAFEVKAGANSHSIAIK